MAGEPLTIFDPRRNFQTQGFTGRGATTTIHDASATGVSVSGIFQAAEDFAVLGLLQRLRLLQPPPPEAPAADGPLRPGAGVRYRVRPRARRRDAARRRQVPVRLVGLDDLRLRQGRRWRDPRGEAPLVRHGGVRRRDARQCERRGVGHAAGVGRRPHRRSRSATRFTIASRGASSTNCPGRSPRPTAPSTCGPPISTRRPASWS